MNRRKMLVTSLVIGAMGLVPLFAQAQGKGMVGVSMPTKSSARWIDDGNNMVKYLKEAGYAAELQYADDDIPNQLAQIENLVTKGAKVLVIAAIDGSTLSDVLHMLTPREEQVIRMRYGLDDGQQRTLEEVGKAFNVTRERIRQIEVKALRKIKRPNMSKNLVDYMD